MNSLKILIILLLTLGFFIFTGTVMTNQPIRYSRFSEKDIITTSFFDTTILPIKQIILFPSIHNNSECKLELFNGKTIRMEYSETTTNIRIFYRGNAPLAYIYNGDISFKKSRMYLFFEANPGKNRIYWKRN